MITQDDSLRSSDEEPTPLIPHPDSLEISDKEVRRLQQILNSSGGTQYTFDEAKCRGLELLQLTLMASDPKGYEHHLQHAFIPPGLLMPQTPAALPGPQAFPIPLDGDHQAIIERSLKVLTNELRYVKRRPTHWRWALVAIYDALGHTLAEHLPANFLPYAGLGQLTRLFDAVAAEMPELPQVRSSVELVDRLRTAHITRGVTLWPVRLGQLPDIFADCERVIRRLRKSGE